MLPDREKIEPDQREQRRIVYEKLSYGIYIDEDRKTALLAKRRTQQETAITELTYRKNQLTREIDRYDLHKLYQELKDFERQKAEVDAQAAGAFTEDGRIQRMRSERSEVSCMRCIPGRQRIWRNRRSGKKENRVETENTKKEVEKEFGENEQKIRKLGVDIGCIDFKSEKL